MIAPYIVKDDRIVLKEFYGSHYERIFLHIKIDCDEAICVRSQNW
jgi:hypothetical protein